MTKVEYVQYPYSEIATQIATNFAKQDGLFFDAYDLEINENIEECHILSTPSKREFPLKTRIDYFNKIRSLILTVSMYRLDSIVLPKKILCEDIPNKRKYSCALNGFVPGTPSGTPYLQLSKTQDLDLVCHALTMLEHEIKRCHEQNITSLIVPFGNDIYYDPNTEHVSIGEFEQLVTPNNFFFSNLNEIKGSGAMTFPCLYDKNGAPIEMYSAWSLYMLAISMLSKSSYSLANLRIHDFDTFGNILSKNHLDKTEFADHFFYTLRQVTDDKPVSSEEIIYPSESLKQLRKDSDFRKSFQQNS